MSTTMVETYDTQMLDYQNDTDFSMQVSSSDPWFQDEAIMDDDGHSTHEETNISIEVDMGPYVEEPTLEYEMADGSETYELDEELVDVEVYHASRAHSPDMLQGDAPLAMPTSDPPDPHQISPEYPKPHLIISHKPAAQAETVDSSFPDMSGQFIPSLHTEPSPLLAHARELPQATLESETSPASNTVELDVIDNYDSLALNSSGVVAEVTHLGVGADLERSITAAAEEEEAPDAPNFENHDSNPLQIPADTSLDGQEVVHPEQGEEAEEGHLEFDPSSGSTGDPHEISEGVYIDPPPAVLVSFSVDSPMISLFNVPAQSEQKCQSETSNFSGITILLGHLPTLYYEPLSSVFEALRQEEYFDCTPNLLNGELRFEAYDLELVMSEDHTYSHELSLHDLNVLHDGLNKQGPLRLRLRSVMPRFIDRYRMLQDQIAQLQLTEARGPEEQNYIATYLERDDHAQKDHQPKREEHSHEQRETLAEAAEAPPPPDDQEQEQVTGGRLDDQYPSIAESKDERTDEQQVDYREEQTTHTPQEDDREQAYAEAPDNSSSSFEEGTGHSEDDDTVGEYVVSDAVEGDLADGFGEVDEQQATESPRQLLGRDVKDDAETTLVWCKDIEHEDSGSEDDNPKATESVSECRGTDDRPPLDEEPKIGEFLTTEYGSSSGPILSNVEDLHDMNSSEVAEEGHESDVAGSSANLANADLVQDMAENEEVPYAADDPWDDTLDGEGELDTTWEVQEQEHETASNQSSVTLSSKSSTKRGISEVEIDEYQDGTQSPPSSPVPKRPRVE